MYSKRALKAKLFFIFSFAGLFIYIVLSFSTFHTAYTMSQVTNIQSVSFEESIESGEDDLKYILIYKPNAGHESENHFKEGRQEFIEHQCPYTNCYLTTRKKLKKDMRSFNAVVINVTDLVDMQELPKLRSIKQKYVFYGMEPSDRTPICREDVDNYFNWTWSYKLYSDIVSPFFIVKNRQGEVIAPKHNVHWDHNTIINHPSQQALGDNGKYRKYEYFWEIKQNASAVAMVVRNCNDSNGKIYVKKLRAALSKFKLDIDIFGCDKKCPNITEGGCGSVIKNNYYFFFVHETSLTEDYLTDKVLDAYSYGAVPIVKSGAQLTKFLPTGSYINALHINPEDIASIINYSIWHAKNYLNFFKWKEFYTLHRRRRLEGICQLCEFLHDKRWVNNQRAYDSFRRWWYKGPLDEMCGKNIRTNIGV